MNRTSFRKMLAPGAAALALSVSLTACGAANEGGSSDDAGSGDGSSLSGTLSGGGASSQEAAQNAWRAGFQEANPDVTVNYDPIGSGGGREQFSAGGFPFAGSDSYLTDDEGELSAAAEQCGSDPIEIPNYVSPIAVIYNIEGVDSLNLSPEVIAGIFNDEITSWDDPAIAELNQGVELPSESITAVHRSDESGTTENFTNFLATVAEYNAAATSEAPFDPTVKDGKGTDGLALPKSNWANRLDAPPYEAFAVTCGITFTFGGVRIATDGSVLDQAEHRIPGLFACGELVGGMFYHNYPGGSGLTWGSVIGRIAGASAGARVVSPTP